MYKSLPGMGLSASFFLTVTQHENLFKSVKKAFRRKEVFKQDDQNKKIQPEFTFIKTFIFLFRVVSRFLKDHFTLVICKSKGKDTQQKINK